MEVQNEQAVVLGVVDRPIKIEQEEENEPACEANEQDIPCVSSVPVPAANSGVFYFPTQAILTPGPGSPFSFSAAQYPHLRSIQRIAHKRKTIEALAQGAIMNADEPILFEETIWCDNAKIIVFDNNTKLEVPRDTLRKENATTVTTSMSPQNTVGLEKTTGNFPKIGNCFSLGQKSCSSTQSKGEVTMSTQCATTAYRKSTMSNTNTNAGSNQATLLNSTVAVRTHEQSQRVGNTCSSSTATSSTSSPLSIQDSPSDSTRSSLNKTISNQSTFNTLAAAHSTHIRPELSKVAVRVPNSVSDTAVSTPSRAVYIPREINVGSAELGLEDCVNVKDICDKELTKWTTEDVARFVRATDCSEYADVFIEQEIDGKALTLLNQDLLIQWMKLKLGPAMKLNSHILNLKHALNNMP